MRARSVAAALLTCLLAVPAALANENPATVTDGRTGLVWVADPEFAVSSGFANGVVLSRVRAQRLVARMNAGTLPNFGRTDWRLPTHRELHRFLRRQGVGGGQPDARSNKVRVWPVAGAATLPGVPLVAVLGTNSVRLHRDSQVTGNVVVNDASPGPTLGGFELKLDRGSKVTGNVKADSIRLDQQSMVTGNAAYNDLSNGGSIGSLTSPQSLPVFPLLPVFQTSSPRPDAPDVFVAGGSTTILAAGEYDAVEVAAGGTLVLAGGVYQVRSLTLAGDCAFPCSTLAAAAGADVRVAGRLAVGTSSFVGPQAGSGIGAADIVVYVGAVNGATGGLGQVPAAATVGRGSTFRANLYAPNGTIQIERDCTTAGAFFGRDVALDQNTTVTLASYFVNHPPVAFPGVAFTEGTTPITITLRGADPDADSLTFSIVGGGPQHGTLGPVAHVTPPPPLPDPSRPDPGPQPVTEATVEYTPNAAGDVEDSFTFQVSDGFGGTGSALVTINPPGSEAPPGTVVAFETSETTATDTPVTLTLTADAPEGVAVSFTIVLGSGPANGDLSGLTQGSEVPQRTATVVYTPDTGFNGFDQFQFEACGTVGTSVECDTATATVEITPSGEPGDDIAPDKTLSTPQDTPVSFNLGASSGVGSSTAASTLQRLVGKAISLDPAEVAGNVADAEPDGFGDNANDLSSSAPLLISAGVGQSGGPGSNGTVRIHMEWDVQSVGPVGNDSSAQITLTTNRGSVDVLDTFFFAGAGGNGELEVSDFESGNGFEQLAGVAMPVTGLQGADGTFSFDVREALNDALAAGATYFAVQGRVAESTAGNARGMQIYSTVNNPLNDGKVPALIISSPPPIAPTTYVITSLPAFGVLRDQANNPITSVPFTLTGSFLTYQPNTGFQGDDSFGYEATFGTIVDLGTILIRVRFLDCLANAADCDDGR